MKASPPLIVEAWVPKAIVAMAERLGAEFQSENNLDGLSVLSRLLVDPRMKLAWAELYKNTRENYKSTDDFIHPACVSPASKAKKLREEVSRLRKEGEYRDELGAKLAEAEAKAWEALPDFGDHLNEQDLAARRLFGAACCLFLDNKPTFLSDLQSCSDQLHNVAFTLDEQSKILATLGYVEEALVLMQIAELCSEDSFNGDPSFQETDLAVVGRNRGDLAVRAFVLRLSAETKELFQKNLYGTVAIFANVVFESNLMTGQKVREMLRSPPGGYLQSSRY